MIIEDIKNIKSGRGQLRQFGITIGVVLVLLSGIFFLKGKDLYTSLLAISLIFLFLGLICPKVLKPIQKVWMSLAIVIGWFMTRLIMIILFFLIVTPIGIIGRLLKKQFLDLGFKKDNKDSYWIPHSAAADDIARYEKQF